MRSRGAELIPGEEMRKNEMLVSENGRYAAVFDQGGVGGDLRLYDMFGAEPRLLWVSDDRGENTDDGWMTMQADGNLVIYDDGNAGFASGTNAEDDAPHGAFTLRLKNHGNLVVRDQVTGGVLSTGGVGENDDKDRGRFLRRAAPAAEGMGPEGASESANAARQSIMFTEDGTLTYLASDPDLVRAWRAGGSDAVLRARQHFQETGQFAEVPMDFDPQSYIAAPGNENLCEEFQGDEAGATLHYVEAGVVLRDAGDRAQLRLDANDEPNGTAAIWDDVMETELGAVLYLASSPELVEAANREGARREEHCGLGPGALRADRVERRTARSISTSMPMRARPRAPM